MKRIRINILLPLFCFICLMVLGCGGGGSGISIPETPASISRSTARGALEGTFFAFKQPPVFVLSTTATQLPRLSSGGNLGSRERTPSVIMPQDNGGTITYIYSDVALGACRLDTVQGQPLTGVKGDNNTLSLTGTLVVSNCLTDPFWENGYIVFSNTSFTYNPGAMQLMFGTMHYVFTSNMENSDLTITTDFTTAADGSGTGTLAYRHSVGVYQYSMSIEFTLSADGKYGFHITGNSEAVLAYNMTFNPGPAVEQIIGYGVVSTRDNIVITFCDGCININPHVGHPVRQASFSLNNSYFGVLNFYSNGSGDGQILNPIGEPVADLDWTSNGLVTIDYRDNTPTDDFQL